ncbi:MAG TPA: ABC transporter substrate-binding protein [Streptosporangiaceae bacterium]|nr:ABC transporter substrate-binding protein [Streptosporangiaceae bacterium]
MEFRVLGPLEVWAGGQAIPLGGAKQRALLAALLLHANEVVSRARLIDGLWGEEPPATAAHTIETYVSRLRRVLHGAGSRDALITRPPGYMLRIDPAELDLNRFEDLCREGRRALADGNPGLAAERFRQALALFRGPPLDDVAFFPFAQAELGRLAEMRLAALEDRVDADLAARKSGELVGELEALVKAYPLRERLHGQLMLALYRAGRQADGLDAYRKARQYLAEELGVEPGAALRQLEHAMLVHDPSLEAASRGTGPGAARIPSRVASAAGAAPVPPRGPAVHGGGGPPAAPAQMPEPPPPAIRGTGRRQPAWRSTALPIALVLLVSLAVVGVTTAVHVRAGRTSVVHGDAIGIIDPGTGALTGTVPLTASAGQIAAGAGSVWVANFAEHTVTRIEGGAVRQVIRVGSGPSGITAGNGAVWVADSLDGTVARIDPGTSQVVQTIPVGDGPSGIAYGQGAVWVANAGDRTVAKIDPRTGRVTRRVGLDVNPAGLAVGAGSVWVTSQSANEVLRISPDGTDVDAIRVGNGPGAIAASPGAVWVANSLDGTVSRIDPSRDVVTATLQVGNDPSGLAISPDAVWVADGFQGTVTRIDPGTPAVAQTVRVGDRSAAIAVVGGAIWVVVHALPAHQGGTLRIVAAIPRLDSIDPGMAFLLFPPQLLGMTNDGLVTLRHTGGSDGTQLVPDLAVSLPAPTYQGRSYRFQLRRGIRYSDGEPVRPGDFRRAIERDFTIGSPGAPFFSDIVGAGRCTAGAPQCDLSRGIVVNEVAGTVTFHLSHPDPEFLYKLTLTFAFAVPAGTPADRDVGSQPVPATGPYMIDRYQPGRQLVLRRNPQFHEWSRAAQPDGNPDQIVWRFGASPDAAVTAIERGAADWGLYTFPFSPPADRLEEIRTQHAGQVHVNPLPETEFFVLHTRVPPFNDVRVRQALNYAIDRNVLVSLYGGSSLARPACQVLPPGLPGYQPYCPYTLDPRPDGAYTAPRLALARRLVAASHTEGMRVRVLTDPGFAPAGYLVSVLRELGYRASLWTASGDRLNALTNNSRYQVQISRGGWAADYPAPSEFINLFLSCGAFVPGSDANGNAAQFCDRGIDRGIQRALRLQSSDPQAAVRAWADVDRLVTGQAPWLPTVNLNAVDFVSRRTGGYQFHPQWGILLDQLWVTR